MAREIKFRAWNEDEMLTWENLKSYDPAGRPFFGLSALDENKDLIWMQYTGLKDKNGVEIYEGDILEKFEIMCEVKYGKGYFYGLRSPELNKGELYCDLHLVPEVCEISEVIGNIYQNPELLK